MKSRLRSSAIVLVAVLSGCATPTKMAFQNDDERLTATSKPIFLPALAGIEIRKAILPPFDRAKAQQWWEAQ